MQFFRALTCFSLGFLLLAGCTTLREDLEPATVRVMTYNIQHGRGMDGQVDLERIAEVIRREGADIVALQEVDRGVQRTEERDLPGELAELTGMPAIFSMNIPHQGGEYGNAVLTRYPVKQWTNTHLKMLRAGEQRGVLQLILDVEGKEVLFLNTHIDHRPDDTERLANVDEFIEMVEGYGISRVIFCGDFNDVPGSRTHGNLREQFRDIWEEVGGGQGYTFSSVQPHKRIDYIFLAHTPKLRPMRAWVPKTQASDHLPLVAEIEIW
jgi:endonuclease/exonuclease/phosphatase family metal-dependent hydrolase